MIVTFTNIVKGKNIHVQDARTSTGSTFPNPGSIAYSVRGSGKTMGAAPDGRELPEWVEFSWQEWPYPFPSRPTRPQERQDWDSEVESLRRSLPWKTERVLVRSRIPQDAVQEVVESKRQAMPGKLPSKRLWIYFEWAEGGIQFHWQLEERIAAGGSRVLQEGGDEVQAQ